MHNAGESGTVDCAWVNVGWHCVSEGESKEPTVEINGMLRGPGLSCSVTSVGFRGRVPEPGRLETLEVVFFFYFLSQVWSPDVKNHSIIRVPLFLGPPGHPSLLTLVWLLVVLDLPGLVLHSSISCHLRTSSVPQCQGLCIQMPLPIRTLVTVLGQMNPLRLSLKFDYICEDTVSK